MGEDKTEQEKFGPYFIVIADHNSIAKDCTPVFEGHGQIVFETDDYDLAKELTEFFNDELPIHIFPFDGEEDEKVNKERIDQVGDIVYGKNPSDPFLVIKDGRSLKPRQFMHVQYHFNYIYLHGMIYDCFEGLPEEYDPIDLRIGTIHRVLIDFKSDVLEAIKRSSYYSGGQVGGAPSNEGVEKAERSTSSPADMPQNGEDETCFIFFKDASIRPKNSKPPIEGHGAVIVSIDYKTGVDIVRAFHDEHLDGPKLILISCTSQNLT